MVYVVELERQLPFESQNKQRNPQIIHWLHSKRILVRSCMHIANYAYKILHFSALVRRLSGLIAGKTFHQFAR